MQHNHVKKSRALGRVAAVLAVLVLAIALLPKAALAEDFKLTIAKTSNGAVTATLNKTKVASSAEKDVNGKFASDATVTLTAAPAEGYELKTLKAKAADKDVKLTQDKNDAKKYTFKMTASDVKITAEFVEQEAEETELEAQADSYTVSFETNGGTTVADVTGVIAIPDLAGKTTTRDGYTFGGWYTDEDLTTEAVAGIAITADTTLYAKWTANIYMVSYNSNGGTGTMEDQEFTYDAEQALTANMFTREGYAFANWNTKADGKGDTYTDAQKVLNLTTEGSITLYAQWTGTYTVKFDKNGGSGSMDDQVIPVGEATALAENEFTNDGYEFIGWNTKDDGSGKAYADAAEVTDLAEQGETVTLYAQWGYIITFDANGGEGTMDPQAMLPKTSTKLNDNTFTKEGSTFIKWNTKADGSGTSISDGINVKLSDNVTLYAQWGHTITFDANGGEGTMSKQGIVESTGGALNANEFTLSGYTFKGWNTAADGSGTSYADGYEFAANELTEDMTLYAQWTKKSSGGSGTSTSGTTGTTTTRTSSTLAKTADPSMLAAPIAMAVAGGAFVAGGQRKRK